MQLIITRRSITYQGANRGGQRSTGGWGQKQKKPHMAAFLSLTLHCSGCYAVIAIVFVSEVIANYSATTFTADGPLAPFSIENSTFWPSSKVLKSLLWIAEKCTNTSLLPSAGVIKPKPLSALNHFT